MIQIKAHSIEKLSDYDSLDEIVPEHLINKEVLECLKKYVGTRCDTIKVEYPYYDSDYLSTYYGHYSQKFRNYKKSCARLHFEKEGCYYGYITLRPIIKNTKLGKTYLSPKMLVESDAYLMLSEFNAHIYGQTFAIQCFPWKRQQTDISVCAHTAIWTIIRYFGNKYKNYADTTIGSIVDKVENDWGRKTPSLGLNPVQISDVFKQYGLSPLILGGEKRTDYLFVDEIMAYVESGVPMVGFLTVPEHAISIIGHGKVNYELLDNGQMIEQIIDKETGVIPHARLIQSLYVMDDRFFPYMEMPVGLPTEEDDLEYGLNQLYYAVVPLYNRMQLTYSDVYSRLTTWIKEGELNWEREKVCRIYITSVNSLKREAFRCENMSEDLKEILLTLSMPKFVWCVDLAGINNYKKHLTSGRIIIDTTCASWDSEPWILRHDAEKIQYRDFDKNPDIILEKKVEIKPYAIYQNNLHFIEGGRK
ncbi:MAG: hypothetical protein NC124_06275 [Clostridium sp.]|nr:hypothetical protein [Clostridium sp.]